MFQSKYYYASHKRKFNSLMFWASYIILLNLSINLPKAYSLKRIELTTLSACSNGCQCQAGEYANDVVVCDGGIYGDSMEIDVLSLPSFVNVKLFRSYNFYSYLSMCLFV